MEPFFQPQVAPDGTLIGFEALLRWNHPVRGIVLPNEFVPIAEKTGLVNMLGYSMLRAVFTNCVTWSRPGRRELRVAANVSAIQFDQVDFVEQVIEIVAMSKLNPRLVTLEITETASLKDLLRTAAQLRALRSVGMHFALDDFGNGYASLACLATLPVDTVKLDRSFVTRTIAEKPGMLESVIQMAHRNGLSVVAEGVESRIQSMILRRAGCDVLQGFYYGRPMRSGAVQAFVESWRNPEPVDTDFHFCRD